MCWNVKLLNAKFLAVAGGTRPTPSKTDELLHRSQEETRHGLNLVASNNSWGGGGYSQGLYDAIELANVAGILFVAAAGNSASNNDAVASYPRAMPMATSSPLLQLPQPVCSSFSNWGATRVELGAPGSGSGPRFPIVPRAKSPPAMRAIVARRWPPRT